jgi:hypothetical protein
MQYKRGTKSKRAQITLFVAIAIAIIALVGFFLVLLPQITKPKMTA